jgi:hypothetical protein
VCERDHRGHRGIDSLPQPGESYVAVGWPIDRDGRKRYAGSAIFGTDGEVLASARAVWIELQGDLLGARSRQTGFTHQRA